MPNYPNNEVEREVRSRVNGAMEELIRKRDSELRDLAASKYAPGPGMGSGPYEQMKVQVSVNFYEALFQQIVDIWVDVLTRQSGKISASDVSHVVQELEIRASAAPTHIRQAIASRGAAAQLLPPGAMKALEDGARQRMNELVAKHRRELQTRLYNQDHPHPREMTPAPNMSITKINSDNINSPITSDQGIDVSVGTSKKGWWETWWGVIVTGLVVTILGGLIVWAIPRYFDKPSSSSAAPAASDPPLYPPFHKFYKQDQMGVGNIVCTGQRIPASVAVQVSLAGSWYDPLKPFAPVGPLDKPQTYIILRAFDKYHQDIRREAYIHPNVLPATQDYEVCVQLPAGFVINEKQDDRLNFAVEDSRVVSMTPK